MRPSFPILCALTLYASSACTSVPTTISGGDAGLATTVDFGTPGRFTDVGDSRPASERSRNAYLEDLRKYVVRDAQRLLPKGQRLAIEITDWTWREISSRGACDRRTRAWCATSIRHALTCTSAS